ncbi:MAG: hypothetical protein K0S56_3804 [Microvirga sp.]|jgi:hypothetical protein|nr:hypothetical protein [Microvirga sp.]
MSGTQKPHFAVDLNEIERQLAQAQSAAPTQSSSGGRHDPLADLARIGGQDDPFEALLANEPPRGRAPQQERRDPLFAVRGEAARDPYARRAPDPAPYDFEDEPHHDVQHAGQPYGYQQPAAAEPAHDQHTFDQGGYSQDYYGNGDQAVHYDEAAYQPPPRGRSRKAVLALGAVLGVVLIGSAGAFMFSGGSAAITGGEPPLITASNEPIKVAPQNPGGVEIPNQNKQIYERAQSGETKVVSNSEQPVDVKQAVRMNGGSVTDATGSAGPAPHATNGLNLGEPRKVRTISIKPDGTLARPEPETKAAAVAAPPAMTLPAASQPAPAPAAVAPAPKPAAATPAAATPAAKPAPVAAAETLAPAPTPTPQRVASIQPTAPAATAPAEAPLGGFSVQLAVRGSEKDAQLAFAQFQKKYAELADQSPIIRKAEVNGNTIFRVRAGPMSRDDASQLCSAVQGQGGQCFVAKN